MQPQPGLAAAPTPSPERPAAADDLSSFQGYDPLPLLGDLSPGTVLEPVRAHSLQSIQGPFPPSPLPKPPKPRVPSALAPSTRGFKIGENQSPMPQDRVYFTFNDFNNLNAALNRRFEAPVDNVQAYRYIFGLEKTFDEGQGSIGIQLPLDSLTADSTIQGNFAKPGGTSTSLNDLTVFSKYILKRNPKTGSLISAGLAVTPRTGPATFAGANYLVAIHDTTVQPFIGYLWRRGRFYLHGFVALDVPTSIRDVTMVYNDIGIGYYAYRNPDPAGLLMALVPTFEVHVNDAADPRRLRQPARPDRDRRRGQPDVRPQRADRPELGLHVRRRDAGDRAAAVRLRAGRPAQLPIRPVARSPGAPGDRGWLGALVQ